MVKLHSRGMVALAALLALVALQPRSARAQTSDPALNAAILDVVVANRILYDQGVLDGYGHVSLRHPTNPNLFLLSRSRAPAIVTTADVYLHDFNGNAYVPATGAPATGVTTYLERFIHAEIYRVRPDVNAVVHAHAESVLPFANTGIPLKPMFHMAGFLGGEVPVFEIRDFVSTPTDILISSSYLGARLASVLGPNDVSLQRGHGYVAVGKGIKEAVFRAYYTQINAGLQSAAINLAASGNALAGRRGFHHQPDYEVNYLTPQEAATAEVSIDGTITRPWDLWKARIIDDVK